MQYTESALMPEHIQSACERDKIWLANHPRRPAFQIFTSRFSWSGQDTFSTFKAARAAVMEFIKDGRENGQRWRLVERNPIQYAALGEIVLEYEYVYWDPYKPMRIGLEVIASEEDAGECVSD